MTVQKSITDTNPLTIAVLCNGDYIHHWQEKCIREIQTLPYVKIVLLIKNSNKTYHSSNKLKQLLSPHLLYTLYNKWRKPKAYSNVPIKNVLPETTAIEVHPIQKGKYSDHFSDDDLHLIRSHQPDVLLRFGFRILRGAILTLAPYGIWSYHHSDEQVIRGGPAGYWEVFHRYNTTGAILQRLTPKIDSGVVLRKGHFKTLHHSVRANIDQVMYGATSWVKQVCVDLYNNRATYLNSPAVETRAPMKKTPANSRMVWFLINQLRNKLVFHYRDLFMAEFWQSAWIDRPIASFLSNPEITQLNPIVARGKHRYYADPFGFVQDNERLLLYENYSYVTGQATLDMQVFNTKNEVVTQTTLLNGPHHFSYPFVIEHEKEIYVVPECHEQQRIILYRWNAVHKKLEQVTVLIEQGGIDPSLVYHNNKWWLFCTKKASGSNLHLYIYYADEIKGPYIAHGNNPVKTDVSSARPGGQPFIHNGQLYRPAQNSAQTYGASLKIMEVTTLSPDEFMEKQATELVPPQNSNFRYGLHTLSSWGEQTLIDLKRYRFDRYAFFRQLSNKLRKR